ncbi:transport and Golgi organization protein 6 [Scaptodrosophila lebanonensis]|uniref:Transport and Golgi organization protein 6 n=1 Tax=Drosophila lebanonensis TaxID=7225 RepID=A0A6J2U8D4_DROLE|nr:transport and Golgi organization protein 6 [Scaptodrosophila lebanonensis]
MNIVNAAKYLAVLEQLKYKHVEPKRESSNKSKETAAILPDNLRVLEKYVKADVGVLLQELGTAFQLTPVQVETIKLKTDDAMASYVVRILHILHLIIGNINFDSDAKEDLISVAHLRIIIRTVQELAYYALRCQLHEDFYKSPVFKEAQGVATTNLPLLFLSVQFFRKLLPIRQLYIANGMEFVVRDLIAAIISLKVSGDADYRPQLDSTLEYTAEHESKVDFFRNVLLLKGTPQLSDTIAKELHHQLLDKLGSPQGFASLVATLQAAPHADVTRSAEIIANIVARRGYSTHMQRQMIDQALEFCRFCLLNGNTPNPSAGVLSLRRLYELNENNKQIIEQLLASNWQHLTAPEDLLSGLIIMQNSELCSQISLWEQLFCSSSVACLPSALLVDYLPLLLQLYDNMPDSAMQQQLAALVIRCLDNRAPSEELPSLIEELLRGPPTTTLRNFKWLHSRLRIVGNSFKEFSVKVAHADYKSDYNMYNILPALLMSGSNHALTYKVFVVLLRLLVQQISKQSSSGVELLSSETELVTFLHSKYQLKLEVLIALNTLISFQPLKALMAANSKEFIQLINELLLQASCQIDEQTDDTIMLMLSLLQELVNRGTDLTESMRELRRTLKLVSSQTSSGLVKQRVQALIAFAEGDVGAKQSALPFEQARALIESQESHVQVYGIQMLLDLLRSKDANTLSQGHLIIALALTTLKNKESYTFLNCVRLFAALVHVMEAEVLDKLSGEYLSEVDELDYRLVVGEAILKVAKELGPLCYKYKDVLLNCFMFGIRSPLDEFRMSAYANLAQLCRLLAYQVHSFFQELVQLVSDELSTGKYLPAKRAAVLVLADLLEGMDNVIDFEEMLLPVYRLLRDIEASENCDAKMREHASRGLKTLEDKCKQLFNPEQQLQKEIKILGINEKPHSKKGHILLLN